MKIATKKKDEEEKTFRAMSCQILLSAGNALNQLKLSVTEGI